MSTKKYTRKLVWVYTEQATSIEVYLSAHCGDSDVLTPITPHVDPHKARNFEGFGNHMPVYQVKELVPAAVWDNYYKFCVERNPWEKTISQYCMLNHRAGGKLPISEYMTGPALPVNYPRYMDRSCSRIIVDRVLKYENLMEELGETFRMLGIPFEGSLNVNAKSEYRTDRRPYQEVFDATTASYIAKVFAKEIALHGYRFEEIP